MRVWRSFLRNNGFLLSAGMSYSVLFAIFALLYILFAGAGVWLGASSTAIESAIALVNASMPGLIGEHGLLTADEATSIARGSAGVLSVTGAIAGAIGLWTAIGAVTYTRRAVREIFGLGFDSRNYWLLKARDLFAAIIFGGGMLVAALVSLLGAWALRQLFAFLGWDNGSGLLTVAVNGASILVVFVLNSAALAMMVRFLTGTSLRWRFIIPGAILGGAAMAVLQYSAGILLARVPTNPLLAPFAVLVGLLLWCRAVAVVILVSASWIATTAEDSDHPLVLEDGRATRQAEADAVLLAAKVELRGARERLTDAPWYGRLSARRTLRAAEDRLRAATEASERIDVGGRT